MIIYKVTCDRCGYTEETKTLWEFSISRYDADHYLCDKCKKELDSLIYNFLNNQEET